MANAPAALPTDTETLQALLSAHIAQSNQQAARISELERENQRQSTWILTLQEQLSLALARRFAARSEKLSPGQIRLFDEAEADRLGGGIDSDLEDDDAGGAAGWVKSSTWNGTGWILTAAWPGWTTAPPKMLMDGASP